MCVYVRRTNRWNMIPANTSNNSKCNRFDAKTTSTIFFRCIDSISSIICYWTLLLLFYLHEIIYVSLSVFTDRRLTNPSVFYTYVYIDYLRKIFHDRSTSVCWVSSVWTTRGERVFNRWTTNVRDFVRKKERKAERDDYTLSAARFERCFAYQSPKFECVSFDIYSRIYVAVNEPHTPLPWFINTNSVGHFEVYTRWKKLWRETENSKGPG